jgi:hypothetical protein
LIAATVVFAADVTQDLVHEVSTATRRGNSAVPDIVRRSGSRRVAGRCGL